MKKNLLILEKKTKTENNGNNYVSLSFHVQTLTLIEDSRKLGNSERTHCTSALGFSAARWVEGERGLPEGFASMIYGGDTLPSSEV